MLRAFREGSDEIPSQYQLVEIPVKIFNSIQGVPLSVFERDAPVIDCHVGNQVAAVVAIDRSDAKITVRRVQLSACIVHAEWNRADEGQAVKLRRMRMRAQPSRQESRTSSQPSGRKVCPECGHVFQGNGWDGIDAHWRSKHEHIMPYERAWPLLREGNYRKNVLN